MLTIEIANTNELKKIANQIVIDYHSYVKTPKVVGRCIKYLIKYEDRYIATFWVGSGFKPTPKAILNHFNMKQKDFDKIFNEVADNKRFCIKENPIPNCGTQILKLVRDRVKQDWYNTYNNNLQAIVTTIGNGKKGSVYLADNWSKIGETAGLPKNRKAISMKWNTTDQIAERYTKPTGEDKKIILITNKL